MSCHRRFLIWFVGCLATVMFPPAGAGAAPVLRLAKVFPPAGPIGGKVQVICTGTGFEQATGIHFSAAGVSGKLAHTTASSATFEVTIAPDAPAGICEARIMTPSGISNPRTFCISPHRKQETATGNHAPDQAVRIAEGAGISANCTAESVGYYTIDLARGRRVRFECLSEELDSKMLPVLLLSDEGGREMARSRRGGRLDFVAPRDGRYTLKVHDLLYRGGDEYFYYLACTPIPKNACRTALTTLPEGIQTVSPPCEITSCFARPGVFEFAGRPGDLYWVEIDSDRPGSDTAPDVVLQFVSTDKTGQHIQDLREVNGIDGPADARVARGLSLTRDVAFPIEMKQTGTYRLVVRDLLWSDRDGNPPAYRLCIRRPKPDFELLASEPPEFDDAERKLRSASKGIFLQNGGCMPIHLTVHRRDGFSGEIPIETEGLPKGISASTVIHSGQSEGVLMIRSEAGTPTWSGTVRIVGRAIAGRDELVHEAEYETVIRAATAEEPADVRLAGDLGIGLGAEPEPLTIRTAPDAVPKVKASGKLHLPLLLTSHAMIKPPVQLRVGGLTELAGLPVLSINPAQKQPAVDLDIVRKLAPGLYTIYFEATVTVHSGTTDSPELVYSRPIRFKVVAG